MQPVAAGISPRNLDGRAVDRGKADGGARDEPAGLAGSNGVLDRRNAGSRRARVGVSYPRPRALQRAALCVNNAQGSSHFEASLGADDPSVVDLRAKLVTFGDAPATATYP